MNNQKLQRFKEGDWITFPYRNSLTDEKTVHTGFISEINTLYGTYKVYVPKTDSNFTVPYHLAKPTEEAEIDKRDVATLVDMALATNDKEWFEDIVKRAKA